MVWDSCRALDLSILLINLFLFQSTSFCGFILGFFSRLCGSHLEDRKKLLQQWVAKEQNADSIEAQIVLTKTSAKQHKGTKELLTTAEMMKREIPLEKIRAIVAKGQGVPDSDCPNLPSLTRFWVSTSTKEIDFDETRQQGSVTIQASAAGALDAVMNPFASNASSSLGADGMQSILSGLGTTQTPGACFFWSHSYLSDSSQKDLIRISSHVSI